MSQYIPIPNSKSWGFPIPIPIPSQCRDSTSKHERVWAIPTRVGLFAIPIVAKSSSNLLKQFLPPGKYKIQPYSIFQFEGFCFCLNYDQSLILLYDSFILASVGWFGLLTLKIVVGVFVVSILVYIWGKGSYVLLKFWNELLILVFNCIFLCWIKSACELWWFVFFGFGC